MDNANSGDGAGVAGASRPFIIATSILRCVVVAVGVQSVNALLIRLNVDTTPGFLWSSVLALGISYAVLVRSSRWFRPAPSVRPLSVPTALSLCAILVVTLVAIAIAGMALVYGQALRHGIQLPGDGFPGTAAVRAIISLTVVVCAGFIEEAAFRGAIQLRLQEVVGAHRAEFIAGVLFVVMHADRLASTPAALLFIAVFAFACGRLAAVTQTARYSALTHSLVNAVLVVIALALKE